MNNEFKLPDENDYPELDEVTDVIEYSPKSRKVAAFLALAGCHKLYLGLSHNIFDIFNVFGRWEDYYRLSCGEEYYDGEGRLLR